MLYAKSFPKQSIKKHTNGLLSRLENMKRLYGKDILKNKQIDEDKFWYILEIACRYHDAGKVFTAFQNVILKKLNEKTIDTKFLYNVKHEQLSPMFIPDDCLNLEKKYKRLLYQIIYYHHERDNVYINNAELEKMLSDIYNIDVLPRLDIIQEELGFKINGILDTSYLSYVSDRQRIDSYSKNYIEYILLKGLLNRLDHSASANIDVESPTTDIVSQYTEKFLTNKFGNINELQEFCCKNQEENLVIVGSTGIGKTEAALIWSNYSKLFFTLPIRISINAIFDRIHNDIDYESVGLLHSSSLEYLEQKLENGEIEFPDRINEESRNLSSKITVCTINQIFPFVFKYKGYEKIYATLSYSKIVIDEIQAYSPRVAAVILTGIKMINQIGGKFMIMTATLPRIYKDYLDENDIQYKQKFFEKKTKDGLEFNRHKLKLLDEEIMDDIDNIVEKSKYSKVLIIVNTVNKALEMYYELEKYKINNLNLLHSRFIKKDRDALEQKIKDFAKGTESGVWITTQIVEASLDIDFDYLFTEMSTLDSLFQRLGRCHRSRMYNGKEANIYVYTKNVSGIGKNAVYDKDIYLLSINLLKEKLGNIGDDYFKENIKVDLVDRLYSKDLLKDTDFLKEFKTSKDVLESMIDYTIDKKKAQDILNDIQTINVIPKQIYEENIRLFEEYESSVKNKCPYEERKGIKRKIDKLIINVRPNQVKGLAYEVKYSMEGIFYVDKRYDKNVGLILEKDPEYDFNSRNN